MSDDVDPQHGAVDRHRARVIGRENGRTIGGNVLCARALDAKVAVVQWSGDRVSEGHVVGMQTEAIEAVPRIAKREPARPVTDLWTAEK